MPTVNDETLRAFAAAVMAKLGSNADESACVAQHLVEANLKGHDSHGVGMLPSYVSFANDGLVVPNQPLITVMDSGPIITFEGGRGFGQRVGRDAIELGIARAREQGAAIVALRNCSHLGRIGTYGEQTVRAGLTSIHFVNVADHAPLQAVFGGGDARLGTNPICIALPGKPGNSDEDDWVVLDMATSKIALGKARVARNQGVPVGDECLIDGDGRPTNDPTAMVDQRTGALLPFGGHKGSGLAICCELLAAALTGGPSIQPAHPKRHGIINNMLSIIIDQSVTHPGAAFFDEFKAIKNWVKAAPVAPAHDAVLLPGEPEKKSRRHRLADGISIDQMTYDELKNAASAAGMAMGDIERYLP